MYSGLKKLDSESGMAAGDTLTIDMKKGGVVQGLWLYCTAAGVAMTKAQIIADVGLIKILVDEEEKVVLTAKELFDIYDYWFDYYGVATYVPAGVIPIPLFRPMWYSAEARQLMGYGTLGVSSMTCEVAIDAIALIDKIEPFVETTPGQMELGQHLCIRRTSHNFAGTLDQEISTLPKGHADIATIAYHVGLGATPGQIDFLTYVASYGPGVDREVFPKLPRDVNDHRLHRYHRAAQADFYTADFSILDAIDSNIANGPIVMHTLTPNWNVGVGAPGAFQILCEEIRGIVTQK